MSSERLYTEAEAVELIQRALNDSDQESSPSGLTQNELWRIAEEAGATRSQFDNALAKSAPKVTSDKSKSILRSPQLNSYVAGELTPDDFIVIDESLSPNLGGKIVSQEGQSMKIRLDQGISMIYAVIASRKGQTSIRVHSSYVSAILPPLFVLVFTVMAGVITMMAGNNQAAWLLFAVAPVLAALLAMKLIGLARGRTNDLYIMLHQLVSEAIKEDSAKTVRSTTSDFSDLGLNKLDD